MKTCQISCVRVNIDEKMHACKYRVPNIETNNKYRVGLFFQKNLPGILLSETN